TFVVTHGIGKKNTLGVMKVNSAINRLVKRHPPVTK
ncbi:MAG: hypothetical protein ACI9CE_003844, partial [Flavobacterium sp.]